MAVAKNDHLLTTSEVAELFRVEPRTVTRWAHAGRLPSFTTAGGDRRFRASEIRSLFSATEWAGIVDVTDTRPQIIDVRDQLGIRRSSNQRPGSTG
jgi:excisionase family DNA binding protein